MDKNRPSEEQPICGAQSGEQRIRKECGVKTLGSTNPRGSDNAEVCCHQVKAKFSLYVLKRNTNMDLKKGLMPCPFTGPKMFCVRPKIYLHILAVTNICIVPYKYRISLNNVRGH